VLARLNKIALTLTPLTTVAWLTLAVCVVLFGYAVLEGSSNNRIEQPAMLTGIWAVLLLSFLYGFRAIPPEIEKPWWRRAARKIHRGCYWLLALLTATATIALVMLCLRLLIHVKPV